jgi:hypothetical protein
MAWLTLLALIAAATAAEPAAPVTRSTRLRIAWGGGPAQQWSGRFSVDNGNLSDLRPLGIEPDEPGSMWLDDGKVRIEQKSGRTYDGVDVLVTAAADATLSIAFEPLDGKGAGFHTDVPLTQVTQSFVNHPLDQQGNHLLIRRAPGDRLRLELDRDRLIFETGEVWRFRMTPHLADLPPGTELQLKARLSPVRETRSLWSAATDYTIDAAQPNRPPAGVLVDLPLPADEGVYELTLTASKLRFGRLVPAKPVAQRKVQLVVLAADAAPTSGLATEHWTEVLEIDPTQPSRWERLLKWPQGKRIPGLSKRPLGSGGNQVWESPHGKFMQLKPARGVADPTWQAYPLPIRSVGKPHLLEVSYPSDVSQDLAISIVEPNAAGMVVPIGLDSGVSVTAHPDRQGAIRQHRLIFWPRTKTPLVILVNRRQETPAVFGSIRVLVSDGALPRAHPASSPNGGRLIAGYLGRPLFPENFSATDLFDSGIQQSVDDWQTFYEGATRLVEYLNHVGYNGLMLSVMADGSSIYPSRHLQPTPRYDTGMLATTGADPLRKDVLELLLRLFDREGLQLIPALQFAATLPELEALRRRGDPQTTGIEWVGVDGATWLQNHRPRNGLAPYYNLLNPDVQRAMLVIARELAERYATHSSFGGLALQLSGSGYAQLLGPEWGLDDETVAHFTRDTGIAVPGEGPQRFAQRARVLLGKQRSAWLRWRAGQLATFYDRLQREVAAVHSGATLYLSLAEIFDHPDLRSQLRPALPRRPKVVSALLDLGIQPELLRDRPSIVLLRPQLIVSPRPLAIRGVDMEINSAVQLDRQLAKSTLPGSLLFHRPERCALPSFDSQSPFGKENTHTLMVSQLSPSDSDNRRRFAHSLAMLDSRTLFDGGYLLPLGQEDSLRAWIDVYRQLPADDYKATTTYQQPVILRTLSRDKETWIYLVNDSPWKATVALSLSAAPDCQITQLGSATAGPSPLASRPDGAVWNVTMEPYDLVAAKFSKPDVKIRTARVAVSDAVKVELDRQINDLTARTRSLSQQPPDQLLENPDFELPAADTAIPGWEVLGAGEGAGAGAGAELDSTVRHRGTHSVRLDATQGTLSLRSRPFDVPRSGRLALRVWARAQQPQQQLVLRMAVEDPSGGRIYYRFGTAGGNQADARALATQWNEYMVPFNDLPTDLIDQARVRFDLVGAGTVWIDDVRLERLHFDDFEQRDLIKIIVGASERLNNDQFSDCLRLLNGYWPRFLTENVAIVERPVAQRPKKPPRVTQQTKQPTKSPSVAERLRGFVPGFLRF